MNSEIKFSDSEYLDVEELYKKNLNKFLFAIIGIFAFGFFLFKVYEKFPVQFLGRRRSAGMTGTVVENSGYIMPIIFIIIFMLFLILIALNTLKIKNLKKDLNEQIKIVANLKVENIHNLSDEQIKEMREIGKMDTSDLFFEKNEFNIKNYSFNKFELPDFLMAKEMYLEIAKYSKYEFKREIKI